MGRGRGVVDIDIRADRTACTVVGVVRVGETAEDGGRPRAGEVVMVVVTVPFEGHGQRGTIRRRQRTDGVVLPGWGRKQLDKGREAMAAMLMRIMLLVLAVVVIGLLLLPPLPNDDKGQALWLEQATRPLGRGTVGLAGSQTPLVGCCSDGKVAVAVVVTWRG